jgi:hypothetical protein
MIRTPGAKKPMHPRSSSTRVCEGRAAGEQAVEGAFHQEESVSSGQAVQ